MRPDAKDPVQQTLRKVFGLRQLRDGQDSVIRRVLAGRNTIAIMPTGAGKSLCYQLPAALLPGSTLVVSPLIALMKDQCDRLRELGIVAVQFNSAVGADDLQEAEAALDEGRAKVIFATPERLADREFVARVTRHPVSLLTIDEAHCISQWGHDFRPAFLEIGHALPALGHPTVLALTATATQAVIDDIGTQLAVRDFGVINTGVYRPNLRYSVEQLTREEDKLARVVELVSEQRGSGIIYTATVKGAMEVHAALGQIDGSASLYHGRLPAVTRHAAQDAFMDGTARIMVATNAFGLGIDKPDIRWVIHYQMPGGLDAYYQEAGRGGRDGQDARCTLLYLHKDKAVQQFFLAGKYPAFEDVAAVYRKLREVPADGAREWTLATLTRSLDRPRAKVQVALSLLRHQRVVRQDRDGHLSLIEDSYDDAAIASLANEYRDKREADKSLLEQMVFYGQTGYCRWRVILMHFGEGESFTRCERCDNCERMQAEEERRAREPAPKPDLLRKPNPEPLRTTLFDAGTHVRVRRYGVGVVDEADGRTVTVKFPNGSTRCFLGAYVQPVRSPRRSA